MLLSAVGTYAFAVCMCYTCLRHAGWCVHTRVPRRRCRRRRRRRRRRASRNSDHVAAAPLSRRRRARRPRQRVSVCGVGVSVGVCVLCVVVLVHVLPASQPASTSKLAEAELLRCSFSFSISVSDSASPRNHHHRASRARNPHTHNILATTRVQTSLIQTYFRGHTDGYIFTYIYTYINILCTLTNIRTEPGAIRRLRVYSCCVFSVFSVCLVHKIQCDSVWFSVKTPTPRFFLLDHNPTTQESLLL